MKISQWVYVIISVFFLSPIHGNSQAVVSPGYLITLESDTIQGYFESQLDRKSSQKCIFSKEATGSFSEYRPTEVKGYKINNGKFYISKVITIDGKEQTVFLEFLIKGKANFYYFKDINEHYFVENEAFGKLVELAEPKNYVDIDDNKTAGNPKYKGQLLYLLPNWEKAEDEVSKAVLSHKSLIRLGKKYHESICKDEACIIFERPVHAVRFSPGISGGMHSATLKFGDALHTRATTGYSLCTELEFQSITHSDNNFSFSAGMSLIRLNHATIWNTEGAYNRLIINYNGQKYYLSELEYSSVPEPSVKELDVELRYLGLRIPLYVNYKFGKSRLKPMVGTGISFMYTLQQSEQFKYAEFTNEFGTTFPDFYVGYQARAGLNYKIKEQINTYLSVNYDFVANPNVNQIYRLKMSGVGVTMGLQF